jgi:hypothetical protein
MLGNTNLRVGTNLDFLMWPEHGAQGVTAASIKKSFYARHAREPRDRVGRIPAGRNPYVILPE